MTTHKDLLPELRKYFDNECIPSTACLECEKLTSNPVCYQGTIWRVNQNLKLKKGTALIPTSDKKGFRVCSSLECPYCQNDILVFLVPEECIICASCGNTWVDTHPGKKNI